MPLNSKLFESYLSARKFDTDNYTDRFGTLHHYLPGTALLHCLNGPAIISKNGDVKEWYQNGKRTRLDGPAVIRIDRSDFYNPIEDRQWWIDGKQMSEEEFLQHIDKPIKEEKKKENGWSRLNRLAREKDWFKAVDDGLSTIYYKRGTKEYHRLDGPAIIKYGNALQVDYCEWWIDGQLIPVKSQKEFDIYLKAKQELDKAEGEHGIGLDV